MDIINANPLPWPLPPRRFSSGDYSVENFSGTVLGVESNIVSIRLHEPRDVHEIVTCDFNELDWSQREREAVSKGMLLNGRLEIRVSGGNSADLLDYLKTHFKVVSLDKMELRQNHGVSSMENTSLIQPTTGSGMVSRLRRLLALRF